MGKRRRKKPYTRRDERRGEVRSGRREKSLSIHRGKNKPICPFCGGLLYSAEGGFYCGGCGWDDLSETPSLGEEEK